MAGINPSLLQPFDEGDCDCKLVLMLPAADKSRAGSNRRKTVPRLELPACSAMLKIFSEKFKVWASRWGEASGSTGGAREYVVQCRDDAEAGVYRLMLAFIHSVGKELPTEPGELLQLLLLAREHAVEAAVQACIQRLSDQAESLPAEICGQLLHAVETGVSAEPGMEAAAASLAAACSSRVMQLLGPLHDMLNDDERYQLWLMLPFQMLRDTALDDDKVNADTEATVLAAVLHWAEAHKESVTDEQLAALFSRIRFPSVPASTLINFHRCFETLQRFDPHRELLLRAISDPAQWTQLRDIMAASAPAAGIAELKHVHERWWLPRRKRLSLRAAPAEFMFQGPDPALLRPALPTPAQIAKPPNTNGSVERAKSSKSYWDGYFWHISLENGGVFLYPSVLRTTASVLDAAVPSVALHRTKVKYAIYLSRVATERPQVEATALFAPSAGKGWGKGGMRAMSAEGTPSLSWEALWAEGSPYCHDGMVQGRFTLRAA